MLNLMVGLNGYTLCSGIICEELNGSDYRAVPLHADENMMIGYVSRKECRSVRWDCSIWRRSGSIKSLYYKN